MKVYYTALSIILPLLAISIAINIYQAVKSENGTPVPSHGSLPVNDPDKADMDKLESPVTSNAQSMLTQIRVGQYEKIYEDFFAKYPIGDEKKSLIYSALANESDERLKEIRRMKETGKKLDQATSKAGIQERKRLFEEALRAPLGDEVFEALVYYRETGRQRELAGFLAEQMRKSRCAPDTETIDSMVRLFKDNCVIYANTRDRSQEPVFAGLMADSFSRKEQAVMKGAGEFLSQPQLDVLKKTWGELTDDAIRKEGNKK